MEKGEYSCAYFDSFIDTNELKISLQVQKTLEERGEDVESKHHNFDRFQPVRGGAWSYVSRL